MGQDLWRDVPHCCPSEMNSPMTSAIVRLKKPRSAVVMSGLNLLVSRMIYDGADENRKMSTFWMKAMKTRLNIEKMTGCTYFWTMALRVALA